MQLLHATNACANANANAMWSSGLKCNPERKFALATRGEAGATYVAGAKCSRQAVACNMQQHGPLIAFGVFGKGFYAFCGALTSTCH